jgi:hypothetical protein
MKENQPGNHDEALTRLLHTWKPDAALPPRFPEAVWRRIERADAAANVTLWERLTAGAQLLTARLEAAFARPVLAGSYIAFLLFAGLGAGYWRAEDVSARAQSEWRARYIQVVDPYQMPRN